MTIKIYYGHNISYYDNLHRINYISNGFFTGQLTIILQYKTIEKHKSSKNIRSNHYIKLEDTFGVLRLPRVKYHFGGSELLIQSWFVKFTMTTNPNFSLFGTKDVLRKSAEKNNVGFFSSYLHHIIIFSIAWTTPVLVSSLLIERSYFRLMQVFFISRPLWAF